MKNSEINTNDIESLRHIQLDLLDQVDKICKKFNIPYWLDFGTLLGAVRNGTFIPWDDDIDISMLAKDYIYFLKVAQNELPKNMFLQTRETDQGYSQNFAKIRNSNTTFIEHHETGKEQYNQGIFIDIFPAYEYPSMPKIIRKIAQKITVWSYCSIFLLKKKSVIPQICYAFCRSFWWTLSFLPKRGFGQIPEDNGYMYATPLSSLFPLRSIFFAGREYPCPRDSHNHLEQLYGKKYLIPPQNSQRVPHARVILTELPYIAWRSGHA